MCPRRWSGPCAAFEEPGQDQPQALQRAGQGQATTLPEFSGSSAVTCHVIYPYSFLPGTEGWLSRRCSGAGPLLGDREAGWEGGSRAQDLLRLLRTVWGPHFPGCEGIKRGSAAGGPPGLWGSPHCVTGDSGGDSRGHSSSVSPPRVVFPLAFLVGGDFLSVPRKAWLRRGPLSAARPWASSCPECRALSFKWVQGRAGPRGRASRRSVFREKVTLPAFPRVLW